MTHSNHKAKTSCGNILWDAFCIATLIGMWPRYIEPQWIEIKRQTLSLTNLPDALKGFKILQFSDLHLANHVKDTFLDKILTSIQDLKPDLVVFTGDFICYSELSDPLRLQKLLNNIQAPFGCFAVLGNHDYANYVSVNEAGDYDIVENSGTSIGNGFKRLFTTTALTKKTTDRVKKVGFNQPLVDLIAKTPFTLLHNTTFPLKVKDAILNITGFGEYMIDRFKPEEAFKDYQANWPGIALLHNPDAAPLLKDYPIEVTLSGHTHGGQVNLPWMWRKFTLMENENLKRGLVQIGHQWLYINRGIGSVIPFRWFSRPELLLLTLE